MTSAVAVAGSVWLVALAPGRAAASATNGGAVSLLTAARWARGLAGGDTVRAASILGTVRGGPLAAPLPDARIEVEYGAGPGPAAASMVTRSDTAGAYEIRGLAAGTVTMYVTHADYDTVALQVTVPVRGAVRIDVTLPWSPVILDSVRVRGAVAATVAASRAMGGAEGPDAWRWSGNPADAVTSTGEPDAFHLLEGDPHVAMSPESHALIDRGAAPDQLLVRVDGLPLWSPVHASGAGALSALSPDVVASMTLHDGALPAALGDRLGGVLDVDTREAPVTGSTGDLAVGPAAVRAMWAHALALGSATGGLLVAGRLSDADLSTVPSDVGGLHDHWADGVATGSLRFGASTLRLVAVSGSDRAVAEEALTPDSVAVNRPSAPWHTYTVGLVWTEQLPHDARLETRLSQAGFGATVPTLVDSSGPTVRSAAQQSELSTQLSWTATTIGVTIDRVALSYHVAEPLGAFAGEAPPLGVGGASPTTGGPPLWLGSSPTWAAGFVEHAWGPADSAWGVMTGLRVTEIGGAGPRAEPRLSAALRLAPGLTASVGLARSHQYVQSLRNMSAGDGAELGVDLPIAAGMDGAPVAQSDAGTVGLAAQLGRVARLTVDGYLREMSGLAVANPLSQSAFAVRGFDRASARVRGLAGEFDGGFDRLTWQAAYGLGTTVDRFATLAYHPSTQLGQTAMLAGGLRVDHATQLRVATWVAAGQPAPGLNTDPVGRDADDATGTSATADRDAEANWIPMSPLPTYVRTDVELLRGWSLGRTGGRLSTSLTLANAFNHGNVAAFTPRATGAPATPVLLLPRSLLIGVSWSY